MNATFSKRQIKEPLQKNIKFEAGAVGARAGSNYGSGSTKMMRIWLQLRNIDVFTILFSTKMVI
jgi:hypothetical protein